MTTIEAPSSSPDVRPPESRPDPPPPLESPRSVTTAFWIGISSGLGIVALTIAVVALAVALSNTGSGTRVTSSAAPAQATSSAAAPAAFAGTTMPITLSDYKVTLPASTSTAGKKTLQIANNGSMQHEILVFHPDVSIDAGNLPISPDGDISEDSPGVNKVSDGDNIDPGKGQTRDLDLSQPGTYVFVCNLPGHYKLGMWTKVTVQP
jgi:uncharacterized cupredoxin-like copper-binding protein